jgi:DNA-directed RNA polymerase subunit F
MSKPRVEDKQPISLAELNEHIKEISERDEELNYRTGKTEEYVNEFTRLSLDEYQDLKETIEELDIPRLKEKHIIKIADFLPEDTTVLDVVLDGYPLTLNKENKEKILDAVKPFLD